MTDIIDTQLHTSSFPATYIGTGTVIANPRDAVPARSLNFYFTGSGNAAVAALGFQPLRIRVINDTDGIVWEWVRGLAATHTLKQTSATDETVDTTSAIVVAGDVFDGNYGVTFSAALAASGKNIVVFVEG